MIKKKVKLTIEFDLNLKNGEVLDTNSLREFKAKAKAFPLDFEGYFYAYFDDDEGSYDTDVIPVNIKTKLELQ